MKKRRIIGSPLDDEQISLFEDISRAADRSSRTAWSRRMKKMQKLLRKLEPIEDKILELQAQKLPIFDEIQHIRQEMVKECVHPFDYLVEQNGVVRCKFCEACIKKM